MAAKQASTKQTVLMLGYELDEKRLVLKVFYSRWDEQGLESNVNLTGLLPMTT